VTVILTQGWGRGLPFSEFELGLKADGEPGLSWGGVEVERAGLDYVVAVMSTPAYLLARRYDPEMAIWGLSVLTVSVLARPHKDRVGQNSIIFIRILDLTYPQMVVVRIVDQTCKYCESVHIIYMTS
jgi:hypothetical protein